MADTTHPFSPGCPLEEVIITAELQRRPLRSIDPNAQQTAVRALTAAMASTPAHVLQTLTEHALTLCAAQSSGISVEDLTVTPAVFRWEAVAGRMAPFIGGTMPRDFSPCTETIARREPVLMRRLIRHYPYASGLNIGLEEVLLVPFFIGGRAVGTVWVVAHDTSHEFTAEDVRVLSQLSDFAAAAVAALKNIDRIASASARIEKLTKQRGN